MVAELQKHEKEIWGGGGVRAIIQRPAKSGATKSPQQRGAGDTDT